MRRLLLTVWLFSALSSPTFAQGWDGRTATPGVIWGSKIVIEEQRCCAPSPASATDDIEKIAITAIPGQAVRDGQVLRLRLDGGRTLKITDCDDRQCGAHLIRAHRLTAWWPERRYYVLHVSAYEGQMGYLVREADGLIVRTAAAPVPSPSGWYAIAWDPGVMNGGPFMDLLDMRRDPPSIYDVTKSIRCADRENAHPGETPKWINNFEVVFEDSGVFPPIDPARFRMSARILPGPNLMWKCHL